MQVIGGWRGLVASRSQNLVRRSTMMANLFTLATDKEYAAITARKNLAMNIGFLAPRRTVKIGTRRVAAQFILMKMLLMNIG